ncbi:hypothetical protein J1D76_09915 [Pseudomonas sp. NFX15]
MSAWERQQACSSEQALAHVRQALDDRQSLEGLDELRTGLLIDIDSEVLDQIERGEWCLVKAESGYADWTLPTSHFDQRVMALMRKPPVQPSRTPRIFRLVDSVTGEPLVLRHYQSTVDGRTSEHRTDALGIAHLFVTDRVQQISMEVIGV